MSRARDLANGITTLAPLASPDFTGSVDVAGEITSTVSGGSNAVFDKSTGGSIAFKQGGTSTSLIEDLQSSGGIGFYTGTGGSLTKKVEINSSGSITTLNGGTFNGTIGSSATFPAGHIIQVVDATYSNYDGGTKSESSTVYTGVADWIGKITITSGNAVLIYFLSEMRITGNTDCFGSMQLCKGTKGSPGTVLTQVSAGQSSGTFSNFSAQGWALDTSPADTTPDYCITIATASSGTTSVRLKSASSNRLKLILFEVQQ